MWFKIGAIGTFIAKLGEDVKRIWFKQLNKHVGVIL
jgi:hypothetical protein